MVSFVRNLLGLTILAVLTSTGYAIHCYKYDTYYNSNFEKIIFTNSPTELIDCSTMKPPGLFNTGIATGCIKQIIRASCINAPHQLIVRSCYFGNVNDKEGCEDKSACNVCTEDGCNGSGSLAPIAGAIIIFFGVVHLFI